MPSWYAIDLRSFSCIRSLNSRSMTTRCGAVSAAFFRALAVSASFLRTSRAAARDSSYFRRSSSVIAWSFAAWSARISSPRVRFACFSCAFLAAFFSSYAACFAAFFRAFFDMGTASGGSSLGAGSSDPPPCVVGSGTTPGVDHSVGVNCASGFGSSPTSAAGAAGAPVPTSTAGSFGDDMRSRDMNTARRCGER